MQLLLTDSGLASSLCLNTNYMQSYLVQITCKISALAKSGRIVCARKLFDEMAERDSIAWNTMLSSYSYLGLYQESLSLFNRMRISSNKPDHFSFTATLTACSGTCDRKYGQKIHALVVVSGCRSSLPVNNSLIDMYGKCSSPWSAKNVFEEMEMRNAISWCSLLFAYVHAEDFGTAQHIFDGMLEKVNIAWNTMIAGHARYGNIGICIDLFKNMTKESCDPDQWTFSALMNASAQSGVYCYGCMVHAVILKYGWISAVESNNAILSFYTKLGSNVDVVRMFESVEALTQVSWNAIIDAQMKIGETQKAYLAFQQAPEKNVISWTSMINGHVRSGEGEEAINLFINMIRNGIRPDNFSFGAVLQACSFLVILGYGKMIHSFSICCGVHMHTYVGNGLVNMYAKCGDIKGSNQAFIDIIDKDIVSWNTMLLAFGLHGWASHALRVYEEMVDSGLQPDNVTFLGLLMTCSHSGLIDKGRALFESMSSVYGISPEMDHMVCMVDMLGRGGYLEEANELSKKYKVVHGLNISSNEALLGACSSHGEVDMGTNLGAELKNFEPENEMSYVMLSNLYSASGQWKEAEWVRKAMSDRGVRKMPGCSWIEIQNELTTFAAGRPSYKCSEELWDMLCFLEYKLKNPSS